MCVPSSVTFVNVGESRYGSVRERIQREIGCKCTINLLSNAKSSSKSGWKHDSASMKFGENVATFWMQKQALG